LSLIKKLVLVGALEAMKLFIKTSKNKFICGGSYKKEVSSDWLETDTIRVKTGRDGTLRHPKTFQRYLKTFFSYVSELLFAQTSEGSVLSLFSHHPVSTNQ
jgi:hypothetical protein